MLSTKFYPMVVSWQVTGKKMRRGKEEEIKKDEDILRRKNKNEKKIKINCFAIWNYEKNKHTFVVEMKKYLNTYHNFNLEVNIPEIDQRSFQCLLVEKSVSYF